MGNPHEIFSAGRLLARRAAPYFRAMLLGLAPREMPGLGTIGVSADGILIWDPEFVGRQTAQQMAGLFIHEVMHLVLKHPQRRGALDPRLDNMAGDLAINPGLLDMGLELPGGMDEGLFPENFGWPRGLTKDEYYVLLEKREQEQKAQQKAKKGEPGQKGQQGQGQGSGGEQGDEDDGEQDGSGDGNGGGEDADHDHAGGGSSQDGSDTAGEGTGQEGPGHKPQTGRGWCGGCAGRPMPGEPAAGNDPAGRAPAEMERMVRQVAEAIRAEAARSRGSVPGGWARWAEGALEPPRIPWQSKLARIARNAIAYRAGAVDHRYDGPGRRQAGIGYGAGKPVLPRLRQPVPRVAVVVDTSGSMGTAEMTVALRETRGVLKAVGADVEFCACDSDVHSLKTVRRWEEVPALLKGGGGTDFRPAFEQLDRRRPRPEVVIFVTDGMGPAPEQPPRGMKVVWVLIGPYRQPPTTWGEMLEVTDDKVA